MPFPGFLNRCRGVIVSRPLPFPELGLSLETFSGVVCLTQSGMITALMSSCIVMPRSWASVMRSWKFSSRRESMNFAMGTPFRGEVITSPAAHINVLENGMEIFP